MLIYAIIVTFLFGALCGAVSVVYLHVYLENKRFDAETQEALNLTRDIPAEPTIIKYPTGPNPFTN